VRLQLNAKLGGIFVQGEKGVNTQMEDGSKEVEKRAVNL
jgi:hypothetical protein